MSSEAPRYQRFFAELKRRRVFRVMAVYGAVAFVVLQLADILLPSLALPDWTMNLILVLALLGFPFAIVLAWAFEVTPAGVRRTEEATQAELTRIIAAPAAKRWPSGLFALAGMTALLAGAWYIGRQSAAPATAEMSGAAAEASIAVLPFVNMSADPEQEYFSDGISEELLNLLAQIPQLRVASRTSAFSFKGENLDIPEIARRLNVAHVLEGSVRKAGNEVRITAQLIDARSDTHLWSETWDRQLDDIFAVQDEIAADVVDQLKITLFGEAPRTEHTDPEAYALYLQGRQLSRQITPATLERGAELLRESVSLDPGYAPAWRTLASAYMNMRGNGLISNEEGLRLATEAANHAREADPEYAPAYSTLAALSVYEDRDLPKAVRYQQKALELAPNDPDVLAAAATFAQHLGRLEESVAVREYVVARDPVNPTAHANLGNTYVWAGRWDDAIREYRTALDLAPGRIGVHYGIAMAWLGKGEPETALEAIRLEPEEGGWAMIGLPMVYHDLGRETESDAALVDLIDQYERWAAYNIAYVYAYRDQADEAFAWLAKAVEYDDAGLNEILVENSFDNIRTDSRWLPFLASIGKSPDQLASIEFEVRLPQ